MNRGVVPPQLAPTWGALPRLAWAQARAFGPQSAPILLGWTLAVVAVPLWLCGLAGTHGKQGVAALGHRSVVMITRISRIANPRAIVLLFGAFCLLLVAAAVATIAVGWFWLTIMIAVVVIGLASMRPWILVATRLPWGACTPRCGRATPTRRSTRWAGWPRGREERGTGGNCSTRCWPRPMSAATWCSSHVTRTCAAGTWSGT